MKRSAFFLVLVLTLICRAPFAQAEIRFVPARQGDHFSYTSPVGVRDILVIAHGTRLKSETARDTAERFLNRWASFADQNQLLLIVPVFDDTRFANRSRYGYGGYRGLFGKYVPADRFILNLVASYQSNHQLPAGPFLLYGHSAGGQFANRFTVRHPDKVARTILSVPGRYSFPTSKVTWPYGAGRLTRTIEWDERTRQRVSVQGRVYNYAQAAGLIHIVVGDQDLSQQPKRPAHAASTRINYARQWQRDMNAAAKRHGQSGRVTLQIIPGIGHDSHALTPWVQHALESYLSAKSQLP
jgi:pimeloyl-ACP methyl ester carboxylesterase